MRRVFEILLLLATGFAVMATGASPQQQRRSSTVSTITRGAIAVGMSEAEVLQQVGQPDRRSAQEGRETWTYVELDRLGNEKSLYLVEFEAGRVIGYDDRATGPYVEAQPTERVIVIGAGAAGPPDLGQDVCRSGIDCGGSRFCKDRGDGIKVCMGKGRHGDFCRSGVDCAGSGFCKARSDGFKVCMDKGRRGEVCKSGIDCGGGLFCKDRGDGWKVCL